MAKPIVVSFEGAESSFEHVKIERARIYGKKVRLPLDADGYSCERAQLTDDGSLLLRPGMVGQGYFDAGGEWVPTGDLLGLDERDEPLVFVPSTLGVPQALEPVEPWALLEAQIQNVHLLEPASLDPGLDRALGAGQIFRFRFNYGSDYHAETAFLARNAEGTFCLVGVPLLLAWSGLEAVPTFDEANDEGDLDFEMF
jgi:hypothetical protein